jgi:hypothetical protein
MKRIGKILNLIGVWEGVRIRAERLEAVREIEMRI